MAAPRRLLEEPTFPPRRTATAPVDYDPSVAVSEGVRDREKQINKKSLGYMVRSGIAGGFAGCAVRRALQGAKRYS